MVSYTATLEAARIASSARTETGQLHALAADVEQHVYGRGGSVYKPEFFASWEVVPPDVFTVFGDRSFMFLNTRVLWTLDAIRQYFNKPIFVNTYRSGRLKTLFGLFEERGFRSPATLTGSALSPHKRGDAADLNVIGIGVEEVRAEILTHQNHPAFRFITRLEAKDRLERLHFDVVNTGESKIIEFNP